MTVAFLTKCLTKETKVTIKDFNTKRTIFVGYANEATFSDKVKDWDFSRGHIIYI